MGSCRAWSVYLITLLLGRLKSSKLLTSIVHIISKKLTTALLESAEKRGGRRKYFMIHLNKRMLPTRRGSNPQPSDLQLEANTTEQPRLAKELLHSVVYDLGLLSVCSGLTVDYPG